MLTATRFSAALFMLTLLSTTSAAQYSGAVRDSTSGLPIAGAVVLALDAAGESIARSISSDRGEFTLRASQSATRIQVLRIGFRPRIVDTPGDARRIEIMMVAIPTLLRTTNVVGQPNCPRRDDSPAAFALWEQAKAGLLATVVAREVNPAHVVRLHFDRRIDRNSDVVDRLEVRTDSASTTAPFIASRPAAAFVAQGFVSDSAGRRKFHGPDAEVLLDAAFPRGYCFEIARPDPSRPNEVGLGFRAANKRNGRVDIIGTVWIDTATRSLSDIVYRYAGLDARFDRARTGGLVSFRTMPNGTVLIDRWHIRLLAATSAAKVSPIGAIGREDEFEIHERGGELASARWSDGRTWTASLATLRGRAWFGREPAAGLELTLFDTDYRTVTDSTGAFNIPNLLPGPYALGAVDPVLKALGLTLRTSVTFSAVRDSTLHVSLAAPQARDYVAAACESMHEGDAGEFSIVGRVFTADGTGARAARYDVRRARGNTLAPLVDGRTDEQGLFVICRVNRDEELTFTASWQRERGSTSHTVRQKVGAIRVDLKSLDQERE